MTATLGPKNPWDQNRLEALVFDLSPRFEDLFELDNVLLDIVYELYLCDVDTMPHVAEFLRDKYKAKEDERTTALLRVTEFLAQLMEQEREQMQEQEQVQEQEQQESDDDYW